MTTMYSRARRKMQYWPILYTTCIAVFVRIQAAPSTNDTTVNKLNKENFENNIIDSDVEYEVEYNKKYGINPSWQIGDAFNKNTHKYTVDNNISTKATSNRTLNVAAIIGESVKNFSKNNEQDIVNTTKGDTIGHVHYSNDIETSNVTDSMLVIPILKRKEPIHTTDSLLLETTTSFGTTYIENETTTQGFNLTEIEDNTNNDTISNFSTEGFIDRPYTSSTDTPTANRTLKKLNDTQDFKSLKISNDVNSPNNSKSEFKRTSKTLDITTEVIEIFSTLNDTDPDDAKIPVYTELDYETDVEVPEDYYDSKDLVPTPAPNTDALSVLVGFAGSVAESVAERLLPKTIFELYKRMQKQSEAIEAERLRSREENGGLGQFGRGILKSISSGISRPYTQLMASVRDIGSLDSDRGFVNGLASSVAGVADGVANVANSVSDAFKDRVQAIFPGTLWCGDGHSATARSHELGLFFLTDTCCRQHDACKLFIRSGQTQYGLTNTGLFTRSHCSCDANFRSCLKKTNSLVSSQIGITYFNVLGPQCFRKSHPIVRCVRRTRITGQKCEEYELDYSKPKMWQWFDSETF